MMTTRHSQSPIFTVESNLTSLSVGVRGKSSRWWRNSKSKESTFISSTISETNEQFGNCIVDRVSLLSHSQPYFSQNDYNERSGMGLWSFNNLLLHLHPWDQNRRDVHRRGRDGSTHYVDLVGDTCRGIPVLRQESRNLIRDLGRPPSNLDCTLPSYNSSERDGLRSIPGISPSRDVTPV